MPPVHAKTIRLRSYAYLGLNLTGALALAVIAYVESLCSFVLLEGAWTAISAWGIAMRLSPKRAPVPSRIAERVPDRLLVGADAAIRLAV